MNIRPATKADMPSIKRLYTLAFPRGERKPFWLVRRKGAKGQADILAIEENGFAGFAVNLPYKDMVMINYFAIDPGIQSKGLGSRSLQKICEMYDGRRLLLEIERPDESAPNNAQRLRRKKFYLKNGWDDANIHVRVFGVDMELMTYKCSVTYDEYAELYKNVFGSLVARQVSLVK